MDVNLLIAAMTETEHLISMASRRRLVLALRILMLSHDALVDTVFVLRVLDYDGRVALLPQVVDMGAVPQSEIERGLAVLREADVHLECSDNRLIRYDLQWLGTMTPNLLLL